MIDQVWLPFALLAGLAFTIALGLRHVCGLEWIDRRPRWATAFALAPILVLVILNNR